jgi:hypothetical protein
MEMLFRLLVTLPLKVVLWLLGKLAGFWIELFGVAKMRWLQRLVILVTAYGGLWMYKLNILGPRLAALWLILCLLAWRTTRQRHMADRDPMVRRWRRQADEHAARRMAGVGTTVGSPGWWGAGGTHAPGAAVPVPVQGPVLYVPGGPPPSPPLARAPARSAGRAGPSPQTSRQPRSGAQGAPRTPRKAPPGAASKAPPPPPPPRRHLPSPPLWRRLWRRP